MPEGDRRAGPLRGAGRAGPGASVTSGQYTLEPEPNYFLLMVRLGTRLGQVFSLAWEDGSIMEVMDLGHWGGVRELNCVEI